MKLRQTLCSWAIPSKGLTGFVLKEPHTHTTPPPWWLLIEPPNVSISVSMMYNSSHSHNRCRARWIFPRREPKLHCGFYVKLELRFEMRLSLRYGLCGHADFDGNTGLQSSNAQPHGSGAASDSWPRLDLNLVQSLNLFVGQCKNTYKNIKKKKNGKKPKERVNKMGAESDIVYALGQILFT